MNKIETRGRPADPNAAVRMSISVPEWCAEIIRAEAKRRRVSLANVARGVLLDFYEAAQAKTEG